MKKTWNVTTVRVALGAVAAAIISFFLPWGSKYGESANLFELIDMRPSFFTGFLPMIFVGLILVTALFLLNHPKLTLIGDLPLLICALSMFVMLIDYEISVGIGMILYAIVCIVLIAMAFATKKLKKEAAVPAGNDPGQIR